MKKIIVYVRDYFTSVHLWVLLFSTLFTAIAVYCNFHYGLNRKISHLGYSGQYLSWYGIFLLAFGLGYCLQALFLYSKIFLHRKFVLLLLIAPAIFAWKMTYTFDFVFCRDFFEDDYWNAVVYWPLKVGIITVLLWIVHRLFDNDQPFYGLSFKNFTARPYLIMLLVMVPLIAAASTQHDFLRMYPRMQNIAYLLQPNKGFYKLLYELSYGTDFFSIELFFRGFLVMAFSRWAGKDVVLPMAIFYCTIHFGKPLGECISSYFGGLILGIVSFHTRTIWGGFMVHVGIAWLMELGGYLGNTLLHYH